MALPRLSLPRARPLCAQPSLRGSGKLFSRQSRLLCLAPIMLEKVEIGWDIGATNHLPFACDTGRLAANLSASEAGSSDWEAELAASLLALRLLVAVILAVLLALLHGLRLILVAFLFLDLALLVNEAFAIGRR